MFCISNLAHYYTRWKRYCRVNGPPDDALRDTAHFVSMADASPEAQLKKLVGHSQSNGHLRHMAGHEVTGEGEATAATWMAFSANLKGPQAN